MTDTQSTESRWFGLSRFDAIVAGIALLIVGLIGILLFLNQGVRLGPSVAFLYPADGRKLNVWIAPIDDPTAARPLTDTATTIYDFGVSPDGRFLAYSERDEATGLNELFLINLQTNQRQQLTNCVAEDADCQSPVFRKGGDLLVYERITANTDLQTGPGAVRIWLLDLTRQPYETRPLTADSQMIGYSPQWSAAGNVIAFYNPNVADPGVLVYNFLPDANQERTLQFIPTAQGTVGALSPDGKQLIVPDVTQINATTLVTYLRLAHLSTNEIENLTNPGEPIDDSGAEWHPDGTRALIERRYLDDRFTRGYQLYMIDIATREVSPLLVDPAYSHGFSTWNHAGDQIVFQRFRLLDQGGAPIANTSTEVWIYDVEQEIPIQISNNAFHPRWVEALD